MPVTCRIEAACGLRYERSIRTLEVRSCDPVDHCSTDLAATQWTFWTLTAAQSAAGLTSRESHVSHAAVLK